LGLISDKMQLHGTFWNVIASLNTNFGNIGYLIIVVFLISWIASTMVYRAKEYDKLEIGETRTTYS
jgi:high-affinity nickel-transport protein